MPLTHEKALIIQTTVWDERANDAGSPNMRACS